MKSQRTFAEQWRSQVAQLVVSEKVEGSNPFCSASLRAPVVYGLALETFILGNRVRVPAGVPTDGVCQLQGWRTVPDCKSGLCNGAL